MNTESVYALLGTRWRKKRMDMFAAMFVRSRRVVDLGGTPRNWTWARSFDVTLVNLDQSQGNRGIDFVRANALRCPFRDRAFEVVFSNSLIEHVGTWEEQQPARFCGQPE
ncbi:MAG: methyltransferase domain-containing protein [Candidatus Binataceae bacterium]